MITVTIPAWTKDALCAEVGGDHWYPDDTGTTHEYHMAKKICQDCPVINECLQAALDNEEQHGVWGGLSPRERRRFNQERRRAA